MESKLGLTWCLGLGLHHEHQRPDRDKNVNLNCNNIEDQTESSGTVIKAVCTTGSCKGKQIVVMIGTELLTI
jgi:Astacin (Peptidase family M12A)